MALLIYQGCPSSIRVFENPSHSTNHNSEKVISRAEKSLLNGVLACSRALGALCVWGARVLYVLYVLACLVCLRAWRAS